MNIIKINNQEIKVSNPDKLLWEDVGITKLAYIKTLNQLAPYILKYTKDRLLTTIRYPNGIEGKSFYQKSAPKNTPDYVERFNMQEPGKEGILINNIETLIWLGTQAALEFHTAFNTIKDENPSALVFDLDPTEGQDFEEVKGIALIINETMNSLGLKPLIKTSGATGLQLYIATNSAFSYDNARRLNEFFAKYFSEKYPDKITIERMTSKRGKKLYFDYLQMWNGKTIITPYSPRATKWATISMPVSWEELKNAKPQDYTILNAMERIEKVGDLFEDLLKNTQEKPLKEILKALK